jgi:hypothetical protein
MTHLGFFDPDDSHKKLNERDPLVVLDQLIGKALDQR